MKKILFLFVLSLISPSWAATITAAAGGGNWSNTASWVGAATPTAADDVLLAITSGSVTVDVGTAVSKSVTAVAFVNNLNFSAGQTLSVSGSVQFDTIVSGMTVSGTGTLALLTSGQNYLSAGQTLLGTLLLSTTSLTLGDAVTVGNFIVGANATTSLTSNTMAILGNFTISPTSATTANLGGTTKYILIGSGNFSGGGTSATNQGFGCGVTINTAGSVTLGTLKCGNAFTFKYIAGTVVNTGSSLSLNGTATIDSAGMTWGNVIYAGSGVTITLGSNMSIANSLSIPASISTALSSTMKCSYNGAFNITCGNLLIDSTTTFGVPAAQSITVLTQLAMPGNTLSVPSLISKTASSPITLVYKGTPAQNLVFNATFTDVDATGSTQAVIDYGSGTLTRTTNINAGTFPGSSGPKGFY